MRSLLALVCVSCVGCGLAVGGVAGVVAALDGDDRRQETPRPVSIAAPAAVVNDRVPLAYTLTSSAGTTFDVLVEYSTTGANGPFVPATEATGSPSEGTTGLAAGPEGVPHVFVWNSFFDLNGRSLATADKVVVRITASTTGASNAAFGAPGVTDPFNVDNRLFATVVGAAGTAVDGTAPLALALREADTAIPTSGAIFVSDSADARIIRIDLVAKSATTFGGSSSAGFSGDGSYANLARLLDPRGMALAQDGALIFADSGNHRLRRIDIAGIVTTIAGTGVAGLSGDGGAATSARLNRPRGLVIDGAGAIIVADAGNHVVRRIQGGAIQTIAGTGTAGATGDGSAAISAQLSSPRAVCVGPDGALFVADTANHAVRRFTAGGAMTTVAGTLGAPGLGGEDVLAAGSTLRDPQGVCFVGDDLLIADAGNHRIRRVRAGRITTVAGSLTGARGFVGDNGAATGALFDGPATVTADGAGGYFVADVGNHRVRQVDAAGRITTRAGSGSGGAGVGDGGPALLGTLLDPTSLARDPFDGSFLLSDTQGARVRRFSVGGTITTVAGNGVNLIQTAFPSGVPATSAMLGFPSGSAVDANRVIFVSNTVTNLVLAVNPLTGTISAVAGGGTGPDGIATTTSFQSPGMIATLPAIGARNYLVLVEERRVRRLAYDYSATSGALSNVVTDTLFSSGIASARGVVYSAALSTLYITDSGNQVVRSFTLAASNAAPGPLLTIAGTLGTGGFAGDGGPATSARFSAPTGVALDTTTGDLYVADSGNDRVRRFLPGGSITTVAGNGAPGEAGLGGPALAANITAPNGLSFDPSDGSLLITSQGTRRVLRLRQGTIEPVAGRPTTTSFGDGAPATQADTAPLQLTALNKDQTALYVSESTRSVVRRVDLRTGIITRIAGTSVAASGPSGGQAIATSVNGPLAMATDAADDLYITERGGNVVRRITPQGVIAPFAGNGTTAPVGVGIPATQSGLDQPLGIAISPVSGAVYVSEFNGNRIRRIDSSGVITTVAGTGSFGIPEGVAATSAGFFRPSQVAVTSVNGVDTVYFNEVAQNTVRRFTVGGTLTIVAGTTSGGIVADGVPARTVALSGVAGIGILRDGSLVLCEQSGGRVRRVDTNGIISTICGTGTLGTGPVGVIPTVARLTSPIALTIDRNDNIYVADSGTYQVHRFRLFP